MEDYGEHSSMTIRFGCTSGQYCRQGSTSPRMRAPLTGGTLTVLCNYVASQDMEFLSTTFRALHHSMPMRRCNASQVAEMQLMNGAPNTEGSDRITLRPSGYRTGIGVC